MHYSRRPSFRILQSAFRIALVALGAAGAATAVAQEVVYLKANATGDGSGTSWENACTTLADAVTAAAGQKPIYAARGWYQAATTVTMVDGTCLYGGFRGDETPIAKYISDRVLCLPLYPELAPEDVDRICEIISH